MARSFVRFLVPAVALSGAVLAASCTDGEEGTTGTTKPTVPKPAPGEICEWPPTPEYVALQVQPSFTVLAPGQTRELDLIVEPDVCVPTKLTFESSDPSVVAPPPPQLLYFSKAKARVQVIGGGVGQATLTAHFPRGDGTDVTLEIPVEVMTTDIPTCSGSGAGKLDDGKTVKGSGGLAGASIGLQVGATQPNSGSTLWSDIKPFDVTIACAKDQAPAGYTALGPAVSFGPVGTRLQREIPFSVPMNPAVMPDAATLRHVTVSYTGPRAKKPRAIPIANPRIVRTGAGYSLEFLAPWLGTYQAVVQSQGGAKKRTRRLTHRALVGISMGGGGTAMFGLRNHDRFDVLAPLGGPVDWTWMLGHIYRNHLGGWLPNDGTTPPTELAPMPTATLPYEHPSTFNQWWYEYPKNGNGGSFPRAEYVQIFRDLALMFGNPNSYNPAKGAENLPAGIPPDDKSVVGDHPGRQCAVTVDPLDGPDKEKQEELDKNCPIERCSHVKTLSGYYDDEFNPKGTFPVITVCDGSAQDSALSPYANTWKPENNNKPLELALAVDYNGNGVRDLNEPLLRQGHEVYDDVGEDGLPSTKEPGYEAGVNEDPAGDDWEPQYNPAGLEGNYRWDTGEPFKDDGLDGVPNTKSSPYDFGEGNGKFDYAPGYRTFLERDSRTVIEQHALGTHAKPLDDAALARLDLWTDGGTRDLFNFAVDAAALTGAWSARDRISHYYIESHRIPGQNPNDPKVFFGNRFDWSAIPGGVFLRYGKIDPAQKDIENGSGQHVGTVDEIARRLQSALYYIGSRWPDAPRSHDEESLVDPADGAETCEVVGACDWEFTDSRGRKGPVSVNLPPGYAHKDLQNKRYPVIFLLHGYGQTPEDLKAAIIFLKNWMNFPTDSHATRLPKAIMVYVDGRCRPGKDEAECIRGTFYTDSVREHGPKTESWFLELMDAVDKKYRTQGPSEIDWVE